MIQLPKVLDSNGNEVRRIHPIRVRLNKNIIPLSTASIEVIPEEMVEGRTYVEMFTVNGSAGIYRTRVPQIGYGSKRNSIELDHAVCEVGDWLVRADIDQIEMTLGAALTRVFSYYGGTKWQLGTVEPTGRVVLSCNYSNLLQTINSLLTQVPDAMLTFDFSTTPWTLGVRTRESTVTAEGRLSRNVKTATVRRDDSQLFTRVWLEGLPGGHMDADTISTYGVIETKLNGSDLLPSQAQLLASSYLAKHKKPKTSVTIGGEDFSEITGETLDRVEIGKKYRLAVDNDITEETIVSISWGDVYGSPYDVNITLSESEDTVISFIQYQYSDTYGAGGAVEKQERKNSQYSARISENGRQIELVTQKANENGDILAAAGISIDPDTGVAIYAENTPGAETNYIGSFFVTPDKISAVVDATGVVTPASIVLGINNQDKTASSYVAINADQVYISGVSVTHSGTVDQLVNGTLVAYDIGADWMTTGYLHVHNTIYYGGLSEMYTLDLTDIDIGGTTYKLPVANPA